MVSWLKTYGKTHIVYILLITCGVIAFRLWLSEHDSLVSAQHEILAATQQVDTLKSQIATTQAQAAQKVKVVTKVVHDAATPVQVVAAIPSLTDLPLATRVLPGNPVDVEVAAQPLMQLAGEAKSAEIQLGACQETVKLQGQQVDQLTVALKASKPKFIDKVKHVAEAVVVGVVIGVLIAH